MWIGQIKSDVKLLSEQMPFFTLTIIQYIIGVI